MIYIFLGKYGSKTAPEVCKALKIARTETYQILSSLQNKGIVSATFEHPIKFSAISVQKAMKTLLNAEKERVKTLEKQEKEITKLWQSIPEFAQQQISEQEIKFQMLKGSNPINGKLQEMLFEAQSQIIVLGSEKDYVKLYHSDFLSQLEGKEIDIKLLTSCSDKTSYVFENIDKTQIRKFSKNIQDDLCFIIKDKNEMIFFTKNNKHHSNEIMGMWTNSSSMIYSMKLLFDFVWSSSKTLD